MAQQNPEVPGKSRMRVEPFEVNVPQETLDVLRERLAKTRWPDEVSGAGWDYGVNLAYMKKLAEYWRDEFDWRAQEDSINRFSHYRADVNGFGIHFIQERGKGEDPLPLVLLHGWPSSFVQMLKIIPLLTDPESHGGDAADSFDFVVPSLPTYGFSDRPDEPGMGIRHMANLFDRLMTKGLGYERYATRASDLGAGVSQQLALAHPDSLTGLHHSGTNPYVGEAPDDLTEAEQEFVANTQRWSAQEMAYALQHSSKPQTLAYGLNDSPVGLAAWIVEKTGGGATTAVTWRRRSPKTSCSLT